MQLNNKVISETMTGDATEVAQTQVKPFGIKDKMGYMFGDIANNMTFNFASAFLMIFYTDVLGIEGAVVGTLFLISRFVDAFTDVAMGKIVDSSKQTAQGKFKPWIRKMAGPVAIAGFLMYQTSMAGAPMIMKIIYMYGTYILWGSIFYTAVNIPYGSMASAITADTNERTQLSVYRGMGGTIAGMLVGTLSPLFIYTTDSAGNQMVRGGSTFTILAGILSIIAVIFYVLCYKLTTERVKVERNDDQPKVSVKDSLSQLVKSRSLMSITFASICLLLVMMMIMSMNNYVFPFYYGSSRGVSLINFLNPVMSLLIAFPLASKLSRRYGKKEISTIAMFIGAAVYGIIFVVRPDNMYVFMAGVIIAFTAVNIFNATVWATITDVIDDHQIQTGQREDGTVYAVNSFARKVGQALAGGAAGWALTLIGYDGGAGGQQSAEVLNGIFNVSVLVPAIGFVVAGFILAFWYPLSKSKVSENQKILKEK